MNKLSIQEDVDYVDYVDNFNCLLCHKPLSYKPMEIIDGGEVGECPCKATFCARVIVPNAHIKIPVRDLVMRIGEWTIAIPCHGKKASWLASTQSISSDASVITKVILVSNSLNYKWAVHLDAIPDFFRMTQDASEVIPKLDDWLPFV